MLKSSDSLDHSYGFHCFGCFAQFKEGSVTFLKLKDDFICFLTLPAITCGHPGNPSFGLTQGTQFNLNDVVRFVCNTGYVLHGAVKSTCQANGQWNNALPKCKSKCKDFQCI